MSIIKHFQSEEPEYEGLHSKWKDTITNEERDKVYQAIEDVKDRTPSVQEMFNAMDSVYNQAIDASLIEVYEKKRIYESIHRAHKQLPMWELFFDEITAKLEALKKKP